MEDNDYYGLIITIFLTILIILSTINLVSLRRLKSSVVRTTVTEITEETKDSLVVIRKETRDSLETMRKDFMKSWNVKPSKNIMANWEIWKALDFDNNLSSNTRKQIIKTFWKRAGYTETQKEGFLDIIISKEIEDIKDKIERGEIYLMELRIERNLFGNLVDMIFHTPAEKEQEKLQKKMKELQKKQEELIKPFSIYE